MYWIFLIIFTFIVFVPTIVRQGFFTFNLQQTQEFVILFLGSIGFIMFLIQEKMLKKNLTEKDEIRKKANRMTKDLASSYSYIGEINRKLDILENVALDYPENLNLSNKKQKEIYSSILEAIHILGKSEEFILRFVCASDGRIIQEIKNSPKISISFSLKDINSKDRFFESEKLIAIMSPRTINDICSCILIKKKNPSKKIEDLAMLKILATQALFLFMSIRDKKSLASVF